MPDQNQSSAAASKPPLSSLNSPTCQSAEFVEVDALTADTTCVRSSDPSDAHSPTVFASKSISYAKLYHCPAFRSVSQCDTPPTYQRSALSSPEAPLRVPYLSSVK
ncbi:unnamed protein product [Penicillium roqueforti FM164]|uniref:Genomic scaffold, ProqFM164S02 n=1 Tax=Penicillium roqueforti (strain FM164) TaxID=1365484 RepID=W6QAZ1_PENRF|nr:unnamed protein product [Penicillium roqueforti FM164]